MSGNKYYVHVEIEPSDHFHTPDDRSLAHNVVRLVNAAEIPGARRAIYRLREDERQVGQLQQEVLCLGLRTEKLQEVLAKRKERIEELLGITERQRVVIRDQEERILPLEAQIARVREWGSVADQEDVTDWQKGYTACSRRVMLALDVDPSAVLAEDAHRRNRIEQVRCEWMVPVDRLTQSEARCVRAKIHPLASEDGVGCTTDDKETLS